MDAQSRLTIRFIIVQNVMPYTVGKFPFFYSYLLPVCQSASPKVDVTSLESVTLVWKFTVWKLPYLDLHLLRTKQLARYLCLPPCAHLDPARPLKPT